MALISLRAPADWSPAPALPAKFPCPVCSPNPTPSKMPAAACSDPARPRSHPWLASAGASRLGSTHPLGLGVAGPCGHRGQHPLSPGCCHRQSPDTAAGAQGGEAKTRSRLFSLKKPKQCLFTPQPTQPLASAHQDSEETPPTPVHHVAVGGCHGHFAKQREATSEAVKRCHLLRGSCSPHSGTIHCRAPACRPWQGSSSACGLLNLPWSDPWPVSPIAPLPRSGMVRGLLTRTGMISGRAPAHAAVVLPVAPSPCSRLIRGRAPAKSGGGGYTRGPLTM